VSPAWRGVGLGPWRTIRRGPARSARHPVRFAL